VPLQIFQAREFMDILMPHTKSLFLEINLELHMLHRHNP
jgi:hypothetical protein